MINETLQLITQALQEPSLEMVKAFTTALGGTGATQGLKGYDLEAPAKTLYPVLTPLRNKIPRVGGGLGVQANWKAITGINTAGLSAGAGEGRRGGIVTTAVADYLAAYRTLVLDDYVTFQAQAAGKGYMDITAAAVEGLLRSLMIQEEFIILGGNGAAVALGTTPTPTLADVATGGSCKLKTKYVVHCVALTLEGYRNASVAGGVPAVVSRANGDGTTEIYGGGSGQKSAAANVTTADDGVNTHSIRASVVAVSGAVAYAWYWGEDGQALKLGNITTINSCLITTPVATGTQVIGDLPGSDNSKNALIFDGLLYQIFKSGSGAYIKTMATGTPGTGTPLTADTKTGIVEINEALVSFWNNYKVSPTTIWVNGREKRNMGAKVLTGASGTVVTFAIDTRQGAVLGGVNVTGYIHPITGMEIPVEVHPDLPPGTILFECMTLPYTLSGVQNVVQVRTRWEYMQIDWVLTSLKRDFSITVDEVLQNYFPPAWGLITNIADG
ncbi:MAG: hypothetical protein FJ121_08955 [Deltaproteobacteria bacterium]|nr:hypothetical protein [Deltaproteobacteria bacterium]